MPTRAASVRTVLGVLLLVAAGLKLFALSGAGASVAAVPELGWFAQSWVQLLLAEWELLLGAWLLSGVSARASWLAALVTFGAFAAASGYFGWVGVASCGCLGAVHTNPWWMFGADVTAVLLLAVSRPHQDESKPLFSVSTFRWSIGTLLAVFGAVSVGSWYAGSISALQDVIRGMPVSVINPHVDFGSGRVGEERTAKVQVRNRTNQVVRIIGSTSDCSCSALDELPTSIPPNETVEVAVRLVVPEGSSGRLARRVLLRTDLADQGLLPLRIACRVE